MATLDELEALRKEKRLAELQARITPADIPAIPTPGGAAPESIPQATISGDIAAGTQNWQRRTRRGLVDTGEKMGGPILKRALGFMNPSDEDLAASEKAVKQGGTLANVTQMVGDVGTNVIAAVATPQMQLPRAIDKIVKAAPILGKMFTSSLYNWATVPNEDKTGAATVGAAAPVIGKVISKTLGGPLRDLITPEAKVLQEAGIELPIGMRVTGDRPPGLASNLAMIVRGTEQALKFGPGSGEVIAAKTSKALGQLNVAELNELLEPIGKKLDVNLSRKEAVTNALKHSQKAYDEAKRGLKLVDGPLKDVQIGLERAGLPTPVANAKGIVDAFEEIQGQFWQHEPNFTDAHGRELSRYIENVLKPRLALLRADPRGLPMSGTMWKEIDSELSKLARDNLPQKHTEALGEAYKLMQKAWLQAATEIVPGAKGTMRAADETFSRLQVIKEAESAITSGHITPNRMRIATKKMGREATPLDEAAKAVMGNIRDTESTPFVDKGMRQALAWGGGAGGPAYMTGNPLIGAAIPAGLATGAAGLESEALASTLERGVHPTIQALRKVMGKPFGAGQMPYDEEAINKLIELMATQTTRSKGAQ